MRPLPAAATVGDTRQLVAGAAEMRRCTLAILVSDKARVVHGQPHTWGELLSGHRKPVLTSCAVHGCPSLGPVVIVAWAAARVSPAVTGIACKGAPTRIAHRDMDKQHPGMRLSCLLLATGFNCPVRGSPVA